MNWNKINILFFCLFCLGFQLRAQELLSLEEAVKITLKNNFDIRLANNGLDISIISVSPGFAVMLPRVYLSASTNNSIQNISQTRSDGSQVNSNNGKNSNLSYGVGLDWTLFDGLQMFARYDKLKELKKLGETQLQLTILNRVSDVMITYFDLVQQQQQLSALDSTKVISLQRVTLAENRFQIGKASKLEVLNAQVDLNTDKTLYVRQLNLYTNKKVRLNEIMARDITIDFKTAEDVLVTKNLVLADLEILAKAQNPELQIQIINRRIAELDLKETKGKRYPTITANTGYNFSDSESSLGFSTSNYSRGWNYGVSINIDIFDGFNQNKNEEIGRLKVNNSSIIIEQQTQLLQSQLSTTYQSYLTNIELIGLETNNLEIAKQNIDITLAKYKIGTIPTIEFRAAQQNYINALLRFNEAKYQAKLSEITLNLLAGNLAL
jgi:outer membrane protein